MTNLPRAFCWQRIGPYSEQTPNLVLYRKNLERLAGDGVYWWGHGIGGICESIDPHLIKAVKQTEHPPKVLFSPMKRDADQPAQGRRIFFEAVTKDGSRYELPPHVIMTRNSGDKPSYFALICSSEEPLDPAPRRIIHKINVTNYRSIYKTGERSERNLKGAGQRTTMVIERSGSERRFAADGYPVIFQAKLIWPYCVQLVYKSSEKLKPPDRKALDDISNRAAALLEPTSKRVAKQLVDEWKLLAQRLRDIYGSWWFWARKPSLIFEVQ